MTVQTHAMQTQPAKVVQTTRQHCRLPNHGGQCGNLIGQAAAVEHGGNINAGLGILIGHQIQQGPSTGQHHTFANGAALKFQCNLSAAQGIHPWRGPAGKRQHAVRGAGGDDDIVPRQAAAATGVIAKCIEQPGLSIPDQCLRTVVEILFKRLKTLMQRIGAARLESVERPFAAPESWHRWRLAINLPARAGRFIEHHRSQTIGHQSLCGTYPGRSGTDNHRCWQRRGFALAFARTHAMLSGNSLSNAIPSSTKVEQARSLLPSTLLTQQSWQAPIMQKPARDSPLNSLRRNCAPLTNIAVNTVSPRNAVTTRPSSWNASTCLCRSATRCNCGCNTLCCTTLFMSAPPRPDPDHRHDQVPASPSPSTPPSAPRLPPSSDRSTRWRTCTCAPARSPSMAK